MRVTAPLLAALVTSSAITYGYTHQSLPATRYELFWMCNVFRGELKRW